MYMNIHFYTILPIEECQRLISDAFKDKRQMGGILSGSGPVAGKVRGLNFHMHRRPDYGNIFFPFLFGVLASEPKGTLVQASVRFPLASVLLTIFFLLLGLLFQLNNMFMSAPENSFVSWLIYLWPLLVFGSICIVMMGVGLIKYNLDGAFLERYLRRLLEAKSIHHA